jgi:5-(carboxyamino)imidazole ribonucleotide synthase
VSARVGVLGGGQLGRMLALAGYPLGIRLKHIGGPHDTSAGEVAEQIVAEYADRAALERFAHGLDVVTYEWENVPVEAVQFLAARVPVRPSARALEVSQDRLTEKTFFQQLGIATPEFRMVDSAAELEQAIAQLGRPSVLKTRRLGYDGKGQIVLDTGTDAAAALRELGGRNLILESFVDFERELSILAARNPAGLIKCYPLIENHHAQGILRMSLAPAPGDSPELQHAARAMVRKVLTALDYVGVLAIELFEYRGRLLANEMAPRVHNSGHWTIEGADTSQFENHLRAVLGLPLGSTQSVGWSAMINLIGEIPELGEVLHFEDAHLHLYGKTARPGRKVGHITLRGDTPEQVAERLEEVCTRLDLHW